MTDKIKDKVMISKTNFSQNVTPYTETLQAPLTNALIGQRCLDNLDSTPGHYKKKARRHTRYLLLNNRFLENKGCFLPPYLT